MNLRYIGPFEVLQRIGDVAYRIALPLELSNINNTFVKYQQHVSRVSFEAIHARSVACD